MSLNPLKHLNLSLTSTAALIIAIDRHKLDAASLMFYTITNFLQDNNNIDPERICGIYKDNFKATESIVGTYLYTLILVNVIGYISGGIAKVIGCCVNDYIISNEFLTKALIGTLSAGLSSIFDYSNLFAFESISRFSSC